MPLFMDRHDIEPDSIAALDVARAHLLDLAVQDKYNTHYVTYWFDFRQGKGYCLVEAPSREAAEAVHREAHGLLASDIIEVQRETVEAFMGRIEDPPTLEQAARGEIAEEYQATLRTILFTDLEGSTALTQRLGDEESMALLRRHNSIIRGALAANSGREVKHTGDGLMASFLSVGKAIDCSCAIRREFTAHNEAAAEPMRVRIGISAGEPVTEGADLFGAAVQLARRICDHAEPGRIFVTSVVRDLCLGKKVHFEDRGEATLRGFEDPVRVYEVSWRETG